MKSNWFKKASPHIYAILVFLVISVIYCQPALMGKVLEQHDTIGWKGMAQQSFEFKEKYGHFPLWTNSMFGGMPAFAIAFEGTTLQTIYIQSLLTLGMPIPASFFFLACLAFYFLCIVFRMNPLISTMAAIAYAWSTYDPIIISVGHNTKMWAIAYAPFVIGSLVMIFQKKYLAGAALLALFFGLQVSTQHIQMVYYTAIMMAVMGLAYLVDAIREKQVSNVFPAFGIALGAALLGLASYAISWYPLQDYAKETMRGGRSEITIGADSTNKTVGGLDKDYAFTWSYGISEPLTFIVPGAYGGSTGTMVNNEIRSEFGDNTKVAEVLAQKTGMSEDQANGFAKQLPAYWGAQHLGTSGPVYFGAVICLLFIVGMVYVKSWHKWWILAATIIGILLAWGKHFPALNYFLFDHLPLYNKFRAPTQSLVIPQLTFPLLAALGLQQFISESGKGVADWKKLKLAGIVSALVVAVLVGFYFLADYSGAGDASLRENLAGMMLSNAQQQTPEMKQQANDFAQSVVNALREDRQSLFGSDLLRTIILMLVAAGLIYFFFKQKINQTILLAGLLVLSSGDVIGVALRYLDHRNFVEKEEFEAAHQPTAADLQIKQDNRVPFRVFDRSGGSPFESARASYFHNSIGGYSPAKLGLYQDLITHQLSKGNMQVYNMLNTRYFIMQDPASGQTVAQQNPEAFGPAWLVREIKFVKDGNEEMLALDSASLREVAIVQDKFRSAAGPQPAADSTASLEWVENLNDKVVYKSKSATNQFAVFSEIYYDRGWNAYIDGQPAPYVKVNYVLRGMAVPAGAHTIEFRFEPTAVATSKLVTTVSTVVILLLLAFAGFRQWKKTSV